MEGILDEIDQEAFEDAAVECFMQDVAAEIERDKTIALSPDGAKRLTAVVSGVKKLMSTAIDYDGKPMKYSLKMARNPVLWDEVDIWLVAEEFGAGGSEMETLRNVIGAIDGFGAEACVGEASGEPGVAFVFNLGKVFVEI